MNRTLTSAFILTMIAATTLSMTSSVDCDFDGSRPFCRWKREWFGMRRSGWRRGGKVKNAPLTTHHGKFAFFRARSRPEGFRSQLRSSPVVVRENSCFVFRYALGSARQPYPSGITLLRVYLVGNGESPDRRLPFFESDVRTPRGDFRKVRSPLAEAYNDVRGIVSLQFVIEAVRGGSKKAYVAIDDVSLRPCERPDENLAEVDNKRSDMMSQLLDIMLPAYQPSPLVKAVPTTGDSVSLSPSSGVRNASPFLTGTPTSAHEFTNRRRRKGKRRRKGRKRGRDGRKRGRNGRRRKQKTTATSILGTSSTSTRPPFLRVVMCDFIEYTQRLQRCLRTFFSSLQSHRNSCSSNYNQLEACLIDAAHSCIPSRDLTRQRIAEILNTTLRSNFRTREVYCEEEGAFVFPEFSVAKQRLQCGPRYFKKLTECSGPFAKIFHLKHGDPNLCTEYYSANECQRQSTAEECNFDAETMMRYGLSLQYQFAHNPFCIHLPFSSWWPAS